YGQLKSLAAMCLGPNRAGHTLSATALVNEAYLKLASGSMTWEDRMHFFAVAARAMRQVLVDHARRRKRIKRGSGAARITLDEAALVSSDSIVDVLAVDEAM